MTTAFSAGSKFRRVVAVEALINTALGFPVRQFLTPMLAI